MSTKVCVISGSANPELSREIAAHLGINLGQCKISHFADGETFCEIKENVRGVDCYVTGDLRHHPAQDFLAYDDAPCLIDVPHWAAEWLWLPAAERLLQRRATAEGIRLTTHVSTQVTDPWTAVFPPRT